MNNEVHTLIWGQLSHIWYVAFYLVVLILLIIYRSYCTQAVAKLLQGKQANSMLLNYSFAKQIIKAILLAFGLLCIALTLLHPQWNRKEETIKQQGRDVFIALDVSRSMLVQDCKPNRLQCAKNKIKQLLSFLACERVGLILFSGSAFIQCPLTSDYKALALFLDQIDVETISSGSTALDQALCQAIKAFESVSTERKNKLLVIFTDGEDFSTQLEHYSEQAHAIDLHVFTVGVGTEEGGPIPLTNDQGAVVDHQRDEKGSVVISQLNTAVLQKIAAQVHGVYIPMTTDATDMHNLTRIVHQFEKEAWEEKKVEHYDEQYHYFLIVGFLFLLIEWLL